MIYRFPVDQCTELNWINEITKIQPSYSRNKSSKICSSHFNTYDYYSNKNNKSVLKDCAIPSTFISSNIKNIDTYLLFNIFLLRVFILI